MMGREISVQVQSKAMHNISEKDDEREIFTFASSVMRGRE